MEICNIRLRSVSASVRGDIRGEKKKVTAKASTAPPFW